MTVKAIHADYVLPGDAPAIADGAVVVDRGVVLDVGAASDVLPRHAGAPVVRVAGAVFPGLVNAHTHLELSAMRGKVPGGRGFVPWVDDLVATRAETAPEEDDEAIGHAIDGIVRDATVAVGDVSNTLKPAAELVRRGVGGAVFHEVFGLDRESVLRRIEGLRAELAEGIAWPEQDLAYAPAPHTLYTLHQEAATYLLAAAERRGLRTSLHLAEHAAERRAIERGEGPIPEWLERRVRITREWPRKPLFDLAEEVGALRAGVLLVHLTDARPDELARVAASKASVVLCPRSNLFIEGRLPPLHSFFEVGIEPALGTDSLASNTSLDVLAECRALADRFPTVPSWRLLRLATANGGEALGRPDLGRIARGARPGIFAIEGDAVGDPALWVIRSTAPRRLLEARV